MIIEPIQPKINFKYLSFDDIVMCSLRYCIGRQTIQSYAYADFLKDNWDIITKTTKFMIKFEIKQYKQKFGFIGNQTIDEPKWLEILDWKE
jgi:hypothetical protein